MNRNQRTTEQSSRSYNFNPRLMAFAALALLSFAFTILSRPTKLEAKTAQTRKPDTLVAVISRGESADMEVNMDAVLLIRNGKLLQPYPEYNEKAQRKFGSDYFAAGRKYRLMFGGGEVGAVTLKTFDMGCNNIHARATINDNGKVPARLSALATNSDSLGKLPSSRRAPTDAERAAINLMVAQIYRAHGANRALLRSVVTTNLTATDLNGDGKLELIGSYSAETKTKARRDLLLIAEPAGSGFKPTLVNYQSYKLPPEGFDSAINFVDQLDLDGDGIAEVFVQQHGFDAYGYSIYKKRGGRWHVVFTTTGDAC